MSFGQAESAPRLSADAQAMMMYDSRKKSVALAYVLWLFLGGLGAHRYYAGRLLTGAIMTMLLVSGWLLVKITLGWIFLGAIGLWSLVDAFLIPGMIRAANTRLVTSLSGGNGSSWTGRVAGDQPEGDSAANADAMIARYLARAANSQQSPKQGSVPATGPVRSFGTRVRAP